MTYPYGTKGAPAVGNGLGGLPRRIVPAPPAPPAPVIQVTPFSRWEATGSGTFLRSYDRFITNAHQFNDGSFSDNVVFGMSDGLRFQVPEQGATVYRTYLKRHSRGIISTIPNFIASGSRHAITGIDNDCYVVVSSTSETSSLQSNSLFLRNTVGTVYYFVDCINRRIDRFTKSGPTVTTLTWTGGRSYSGYGTLITAAMRSNGEILLFVSSSANTSHMVVQRLNPDDLTVQSSSFWANPTASAASLDETQRDIAVAANTTVAIRWAGNGIFTFQYFVYDIETMLGRFTGYSAGGDQSLQTSLQRNDTDVFMLTGAGSGGSSGQTQLRTLTATRDNNFGSVTTGGSTSGASFVNSFFSIRPDSISTLFYNPVTNGRTMTFRPGDNASFSSAGFNFNFSSSFTNYTPDAGTPMGITSTTTGSFDRYGSVNHYRRDPVVF